MEEIEQKVNNYEIALHFLPELEESEREQKWKEIESNITESGGVIVSSHSPKKQRLSYPIKHKKYSYFGVMNFRLPAGAVDQIKNRLQLNNQVMRFLLLNIPEGEKILNHWQDRSAKNKIRTYTPPAKGQKEAPAIKPEEMEKQIEEALGGI